VVTTANLLGSCFKLLWQDENMPPMFLQTCKDNANFQAKKNCLWFGYLECRQCCCERCCGTQLFH